MLHVHAADTHVLRCVLLKFVIIEHTIAVSSVNDDKDKAKVGIDNQKKSK